MANVRSIPSLELAIEPATAVCRMDNEVPRAIASIGQRHPVKVSTWTDWASEVPEAAPEAASLNKELKVYINLFVASSNTLC